MRTRDSEPLIREARERLEAGWVHDRDNREEAFKDLQMAIGDQWPEYIRQQRESDGRPTLSLNGLGQFIFQVANDIRQNPPGIRVVPGDGESDKDIADIYGGLIRNIEYASHASDIYAQAAGHAVACGIGHFRIVTDYESEDVFEQTIGIKRVMFPLSVIWDPDSILPDRSDAKWCIVTENVHKDTWQRRFPKTAPAGFDVPIPGNDPENGLFWRDGNSYRIAEYWYKDPIKKRLVQFEDGSTMDVTDLKRHDFFGLPQVIRERRVESNKVKSALLSAVDVLEEPSEWAGRHIPIVPVLGAEMPLDTKLVRFGLIRFARDAQQLYNYARSAAAEAVGLAPKSPYLVTAKMIAKYKSQWNSHNTTQRPYLMYDPDEKVPSGPKREAPPDIPAALIQEAQISAEDMKRTTGIYDASLGARSNETSGVAITARERQGDVATAHFSGNLQISLMHAGRILTDLIPKIYDTQRIISILGEDETEDFVPINKVVISDNGMPILMNDLNHGRYSVRLRSGPSYATRRLEAADSMLNFVQAVPQAAAVIGDLIASNMDWPGADEIAERLKRTIPANILGNDEDGQEMTPQAQQAAQAQQLLMQLETALKQADLAKKQADTAKTQADTEKAGADTQKTMAQAQAERLDAIIRALEAHAQGLSLPAGGMAPAGVPRIQPPQRPQPQPMPQPMPQGQILGPDGQPVMTGMQRSVG